jgi:hypothetical protein
VNEAQLSTLLATAQTCSSGISNSKHVSKARGIRVKTYKAQNKQIFLEVWRHRPPSHGTESYAEALFAAHYITTSDMHLHSWLLWTHGPLIL